MSRYVDGPLAGEEAPEVEAGVHAIPTPWGVYFLREDGDWHYRGEVRDTPNPGGVP